MNRAKEKTPHAAMAIVVGGSIVGMLDLTYAIIVYSPAHPILVPQTVASGILGAASYQGGIPTAVLGVILHFFIAYSITSIYYAVSRQIPYLVERPLPAGVIYGACVYCVMHGFVLPLANVHHGVIPKIYVATEFVEHWFFVGLPIAFTVQHFSTARSTSIGHAERQPAKVV